MPSIEETIRHIVREEVRAALAEWQPHRLAVAVTPAPQPPAPQPPAPRPAAAPAPLERADGLLGLKAAAAWLDVAEATLRDWRVDRKGPPAVKFGRLVKYHREDLDQWISDRATRDAQPVRP